MSVAPEQKDRRETRSSQCCSNTCSSALCSSALLETSGWMEGGWDHSGFVPECVPLAIDGVPCFIAPLFLWLKVTICCISIACVWSPVISFQPRKVCQEKETLSHSPLRYLHTHHNSSEWSESSVLWSHPCPSSSFASCSMDLIQTLENLPGRKVILVPKENIHTFATCLSLTAVLGECFLLASSSC